MQLTRQQLNHFETFSFLVFKQYLTPSKMERFSQEFDAGLDSWLPPGTRHDARARHYASLMDKTTPFIASLHDDLRFVDVAEQLLGKDVLGISVHGSYFVGDTGWHADGHPIGSDGEAEDATNGDLRVNLVPTDNLSTGSSGSVSSSRPAGNGTRRRLKRSSECPD